MPVLSAIFIHPIKSLEPVPVSAARILRSGALEGDRAFAFVDAKGKFFNGKRTPLIHQIRSHYDPLSRVLKLGRAGRMRVRTFQIDDDRAALDAWLSEFFNEPASFVHNGEVGFPDDLDCAGPTLISTPTLSEVASWFPPLAAQQLRARLRVNLEISAPVPFWEERLYTVKGATVRFELGDVTIEGNNPCQRCAVPPRDPHSGEDYPRFAQIFAQRRKATLPPWAEASRFNHYYRLSINTIIAPIEEGKMLRVGDELRLVDTPAAKPAELAAPALAQ